ncbi:hypothetical protein [Duganella callida]|uniref:hypothetical protein n=1 Tax=Duganella callida TaxID=2561932 RepID=UPI00197A7595|nr:hypothetical protein [Duganella callida]
MKIIDQRFLDCDNRYSTLPCLLGIVEVDDAPPAALRALDRRLYALLPGVKDQRALVGLRCNDVPQLVQTVQQVALELRRIAFNEVSIGFVGVVPHMQRRYRLVLPYSVKNAAAPALKMATQLVDALLKGRSFNLQAAIARLRALADRRSQPRQHLVQSARSALSALGDKARRAARVRLLGAALQRSCGFFETAA